MHLTNLALGKYIRVCHAVFKMYSLCGASLLIVFCRVVKCVYITQYGFRMLCCVVLCCAGKVRSFRTAAHSSVFSFCDIACLYAVYMVRTCFGHAIYMSDIRSMLLKCFAFKCNMVRYVCSDVECF